MFEFSPYLFERSEAYILQTILTIKHDNSINTPISIHHFMTLLQLPNNNVTITYGTQSIVLQNVALSLHGPQSMRSSSINLHYESTKGDDCTKYIAPQSQDGIVVYADSISRSSGYCERRWIFGKKCVVLQKVDSYVATAQIILNGNPLTVPLDTSLASLINTNSQITILSAKYVPSTVLYGTSMVFSGDGSFSLQPSWNGPLEFDTRKAFAFGCSDASTQFKSFDDVGAQFPLFSFEALDDSDKLQQSIHGLFYENGVLKTNSGSVLLQIQVTHPVNTHTISRNRTQSMLQPHPFLNIHQVTQLIPYRETNPYQQLLHTPPPIRTKLTLPPTYWCLCCQFCLLWALLQLSRLIANGSIRSISRPIKETFYSTKHTILQNKANLSHDHMQNFQSSNHDLTLLFFTSTTQGVESIARFKIPHSIVYLQALTSLLHIKLHLRECLVRPIMYFNMFHSHADAGWNQHSFQ